MHLQEAQPNVLNSFFTNDILLPENRDVVV